MKTQDSTFPHIRFLLIPQAIARTASVLGKRRLTYVLLLAALQSIFGVIGVVSVGPLLAVALRTQEMRAWLADAGMTSIKRYSDQQITVSFALIMVVTVLIATALNLITEYQRSRFCFDSCFELRAKMVKQLEARPYADFVRCGPNSTIHVLQNVIERMCGQVLLPALELVAKAGTAFLLIVVLLAVDLPVTLLASAAFALFFGALFGLTKPGLRKFRDRMIRSGVETQKLATEFVSGVKTLRVHNAEAFYASGYLRVARERADAMAIQPLYSNAPKYLLECLLFVSIACFLVASVIRNNDLVSQLSRLSVMALAAYRLMPSCQQIYYCIAQLSANFYLLTELHNEMAATAEEPSLAGEEDAASCPRLDKSIVLDAVSFRYPGSSQNVLKSITLTLKHGESLGISGESGAGKSTLVDILLGLYTPTSGAIQIDGVTLTNNRLRSWRSQVGYVPQEVFLTDDTIRRNIAIGQTDNQIDAQRMNEVARVAQIESLINSLPNGYETMVGDRGARLSGGQKQRLALARALYFRPRVLVLDEATSALDKNTESSLMQAVEKLHGSITIIMIAHRLSTLESCDLRVELSGGKLTLLNKSNELPA